RGEAIRVSDGPCGQHAAAGASVHEHVFRIDVSATDHGVDAGHEIIVVLVRIGVLDLVGEFRAIPGATARIGVQHHVAVGGVILAIENVTTSLGLVGADRTPTAVPLALTSVTVRTCLPVVSGFTTPAMLAKYRFLEPSLSTPT